MARPKTGQTPVKTFRPPIPLWAQVMKHVEAEQRAYGDVVVEALHDWLRKKDREQAAAERAAKDGDPDTRCGDAYRPAPQSTDTRSVARCTRGQGHPGEHAGPDFDGRPYRWPERPAGSEEKST